MNVNNLHTETPGNAARGNRQGVALVIVLAMLVLITALVVGFLGRVSNDRTNTASYSAVVSTRQLADVAVNLVQGQINDASDQGADKAWASQPGAVRVFDNTGSLQNIYRLYSADAMTTSSAADLANDLPPAGVGGWADSPAKWVDLNAPVTSNANDSDLLFYPILDPRDPVNPANALNMDGFYLGTGGGTGIPGTTAVPLASGTGANPIPMPVRWMYVLKNGEILGPDTASTGKNLTFNNATPKPSKDNPIVGRIAFWTDDETCKININTAAGSLSKRPSTLDPNAMTPAPWETPKFTGTDEINIFAKNQPLTGEYQRYPGHPATTLLYPALSSLGITIDPYPSAANTTSGLFSLLPRYNDDKGSKGGSANTTSSNSQLPVTPKSERIYSAVGELLYSGTANATDPTKRLENPPAASGTGIVTRGQVESGKFFLTASSRAPELNLFGMPRIAVWPVDKDIASTATTAASTRLTPQDKLIAFCATTTGANGRLNQYIFQRRNNWSATDDFDPSIIPRNPKLYNYLQWLTSGMHPIPGFGGSFEDKYGQAERDQILTSIADYIRSTNLYDHTWEKADGTEDGGPPRFTKGWYQSGGGQVVPIKITTNGRTTRGMGRLYTLSEIGLHVICTAEGSSTAHVNNNSPAAPPVVGYQTPDTISGKPVSPARGSANDPQYVSNLPVAQYLRDSAGNIVGYDADPAKTTYGTYIMASTDPVNSLPGTGNLFPANTTLPRVSGDLVAIAPGEKRLQAILLMEPFSPMMGYFYLYPRYQIKVTGLTGISLGGSTPFPASADGTINASIIRYNAALGGALGMRALLQRPSGTGGAARLSRWSNPAAADHYPFVSDPFTISSGAALNINGACSIELDVLPDVNIGTTSAGAIVPVQNFNVSFPSVDVASPDLMQNGIATNIGGTVANRSLPAEWWGFDYRFKALTNYIWSGGSSTNLRQGPNSWFRVDSTPTSPWKLDSISSSIPFKYFNNAWAPGGNISFAAGLGIRSDVARTLIAKDGDVRLTASKETVNASGTAGADFSKQAGYDSSAKLTHSFMDDSGSNTLAGTDLGGRLAPIASTISQGVATAPKVPSLFTHPYGDSGSHTGPQRSFDWDNTLPGRPDGAYANKPDEGNVYTNGGNTPYYGALQEQGDSSSYFTANRVMPSPVMLGSLPTGIVSGVPWRTLLFRPHLNRPNWANPSGPKDHLLLDLFNMPVVEPYAISEPFSTAGKVNMNYQIVPFSYITRNTAVSAVLGSELIAKVPEAAASQKDAYTYSSQYKAQAGSGTGIARLPLNLSETDGALRQFRDKFTGTGTYDSDEPSIFRSASEICDIYLVPRGYSWATDAAADAAWYGSDFALVGDNTRERAYAGIYPRLTTKSNTFTVHFTVQSLKNMSTDQAQWNEDQGVVVGEYRGSTTLERFLDPNDPNIPDYGDGSDPTTKDPIDKFYKWRVVANRRFYP